MKKLSDMNYSEFTQFVSDNIIGPIIQYDEFEVYEINGRYFYLEASENDASDFFELECIAALSYNTIHDIQVGGDVMHTLFDCNVCGEKVYDDGFEYMWFICK